ncbi:hypothetical protein M8C21_010399 [Ambrosia artemisiifolia]|uniref:Uncharacterized protein n=1 Tax=Ambrosia artemisiifolia TaxID=4212 RepID=A0AAD5D7U8_AMBAR|nr:hypothetical protein M8C21_010399 [Ambrosia artemisiifolia]
MCSSSFSHLLVCQLHWLHRHRPPICFRRHRFFIGFAVNDQSFTGLSKL